MSQRNSEYKRISRDRYTTPPWVTLVVVPHLPKRVKTILEPAAANGEMVKTLRWVGYKVHASDISTGHDFLKSHIDVKSSIVTNPPYSNAQEFIAKALSLTFKHKGVVAMLLRIDFDSAKTRRHLFAENPAFSKKVVLLRRIRWIKNSTGSPSENHAWYVWDWRHKGKPTIEYDGISDDRLRSGKSTT